MNWSLDLFALGGSELDGNKGVNWSQVSQRSPATPLQSVNPFTAPACKFSLAERCTHHTHRHTHSLTHKHTHTHTHTHARTHARTRAHARTRTHARTHAPTHARAHSNTHTHTHTHTCPAFGRQTFKHWTPKQHNKTAQLKADKYLTSHFLLFKYSFVVKRKGGGGEDYPNSYVVFCHNK